MARSKSESAQKGAEALMKALDIIEVVGAAKTPLKAADIAVELGLPRPTVYRILGALGSRGYLRQEADTQGYRLGHKLFELSFASWNEMDIANAAVETLEQLRDLTGETVVLSVRKGASVIVADRREGSHSIRSSIRIGHTEPIDSSILGLSQLAFMKPDARSALLNVHGTVVSSDLPLTLRLSAARGYAIQLSEFDEVPSGIAAPIRDFLGEPFASIAVIGPASRMSEAALHQMSPRVMEAARMITRNTGTPVQSIEIKPKPDKPAYAELNVVCERHCLLGEAPLWDAKTATLYWIDIFGPQIHAFSTRAGSHRVANCTDLPGTIALHKSGGILIAQKNGIMLLDPDTLQPRSMAHDFGEDLQGKRINDGAFDPVGRLLLGIMDMGVADDAGGVMRLSPDLKDSHMAVSSITLPNGIRWSPDGRNLYLVDSRRHTIFRCAYSAETGEIGPREALIRIPPEIGMPDGIAVDSDGCIWVALWDGWSIAKFSPDGRLMEKTILPVPRPTSLCFGGPNMETLFITTARVRLTSDQVLEAPLSGSILSIDVR